MNAQKTEFPPGGKLGYRDSERERTPQTSAAQPKIGGFGIKHTNFASIGGLNVEPANQAQQKLSSLPSVGFRTGQQKGLADPGNTLSFAFSD